MARLLVKVLYTCRQQGRYRLHEFVVMPDHIHLLISLPPKVTVERAMQLVKGGFSYRAKKELGFPSEIWQRGFADEYVAGVEVGSHGQCSSDRGFFPSPKARGQESTDRGYPLFERKAIAAFRPSRVHDEARKNRGPTEQVRATRCESKFQGWLVRTLDTLLQQVPESVVLNPCQQGPERRRL
jgi:hypothetical protein